MNRIQDSGFRIEGAFALKQPSPPGAPMVKPKETLRSLAFRDRQRLGCGRCWRAMAGPVPRLLEGAAVGRYRTRCASLLRVLFLSKRPSDVFVLKTFLEFRPAVAEEFQEGNTNRLCLIAEPSRLHESRQFLGHLVGQIDAYGFHGNSVLRDQTVSLHTLRVNPRVVSVKASHAVWQFAIGSRQFSYRRETPC